MTAPDQCCINVKKLLSITDRVRGFTAGSPPFGCTDWPDFGSGLRGGIDIANASDSMTVKKNQI